MADEAGFCGRGADEAVVVCVWEGGWFGGGGGHVVFWVWARVRGSGDAVGVVVDGEGGCEAGARLWRAGLLGAMTEMALYVCCVGLVYRGK